MTSKKAIHIAGADGELGTSIVKNLLEMLNSHSLSDIAVQVGVHHETTQSSTVLTVKVDPINHPDSVARTLKDVSKLLLLIDPLSDVTRKDILTFARGYINAAKQANVEHVVFPTPFSKLDTPYSPPLTPTDDDDDTQPSLLYRNQFDDIESMLQESFSKSQITILRYPGVLNQHLLYFAKHIMEKSKIPLIENSRMTFEFCDLSDVARASCCILLCPVQRHGGKEYKITGPNLLTTDEIAVKASLGLGREIGVELINFHQFRDALMEVTPDEEEVAYLLELWGLQRHLGNARKVQVTRDLEKITGGPGKSLREFFEDSRTSFTSH